MTATPATFDAPDSRSTLYCDRRSPQRIRPPLRIPWIVWIATPMVLLLVAGPAQAQKVAVVKSVKDVRTDPPFNPEGMTPFGGELFFQGLDAEHRRELWKSDGTDGGTVLVMDINTKPGGDSRPSGFTASNNYLFFAADDGVNGNELWRTDGTTDGTSLVMNINGGDASSDPNGFTEFEDFLFFAAHDDVNKTELWKTNGTTTELALNIREGIGGSFKQVRQMVLLK